MDERGWSSAVVKPTISASAHDTWLVRDVDDPGVYELRFAESLDRSTLIVQRFVPEILDAGEWSLVFFDGEYSHTVVKRPAIGDFRVQEDHGGSRTPATPSASVVRAAERVMAALPGKPLYVRIDGVETDGGFLLMEAECIDPVLSFDADPLAARRFADALARRVGSAR